MTGEQPKALACEKRLRQAATSLERLIGSGSTSSTPRNGWRFRATLMSPAH